MHADLIATAYDQDLTIYNTLSSSSFTPQGCSEAGPSAKASEVQVDVHQPTWCPNGRYLAYSKLREERDRATCWLVVVSRAAGRAAGQHAACMHVLCAYVAAACVLVCIDMRQQLYLCA